MDGPQADDHASIQDLVKWIGSREDRGMRGADHDDNLFVSYDALYEYLSDHQTVEQLLKALYKEDDPSLDHLDPSDIKDFYARVFCLLIYIGHGRFITHFVKNGISDQRLPLRLQDRDQFPDSTLDLQFFDKFYREQWRFCVEDLSVTYGRHYEPESILPIKRKQKLREGGSATTYLVEVHESYNKLELVYMSIHGSDRLIRIIYNGKGN